MKILCCSCACRFYHRGLINWDLLKNYLTFTERAEKNPYQNRLLFERVMEQILCRYRRYTHISNFINVASLAAELIAWSISIMRVITINRSVCLLSFTFFSKKFVLNCEEQLFSAKQYIWCVAGKCLLNISCARDLW